MAQQIIISLRDETSERKFSKSSTAVIKSATKTKTEESLAEPVGAVLGVAKQQAISAAKSGTGLNIDVKSFTNAITGPAAIATIAVTALKFAKYAFDRVNDISQRLNEYEDIRLRAGGTNRGLVNQYGVRRNIFGRYVTPGTYFRR